MQKILAVVRREFIERVRTKAFMIGTILGPVFFGAILLEALYYRFALGRPYGWLITASNLAVALGRLDAHAQPEQSEHGAARERAVALDVLVLLVRRRADAAQRARPDGSLGRERGRA